MTTPDPLASMTPEELIAVIERGLTADEQAAREAGNRRWLVEDNMISLWPEREDDGFMSWPTRADARHAYRHDPSRVLADVKSKRRIVATFVELDTHPNRLVYAQLQQQWVALRAVMTALARPYLDQETP